MDYSTAKQQADKLWNASRAAAYEVNKLTGVVTSPLGLTPDAVKATPEWKAAKAQADAAFMALRNYNAWFTKAFKKEIAADRNSRYAA